MKKNTRKKIGIIILILIIAFWSLLFFMRNKSPNWCNLTLGTYDVQGFKTVDLGIDRSVIDIYGCEGGMFGFMDRER